MIDMLFLTLTLLSALGCSLMAGTFFIISNTVMRAVALLQPSQGIAAMKSTNNTILNPLFFVRFLDRRGCLSCCAPDSSDVGSKYYVRDFTDLSIVTIRKIIPERHYVMNMNME